MTTEIPAEQSNNAWNSYEIEEILKLPYFFGFLNSEETKKCLNNEPKGTFLIRFSSEAGRYTLSACIGSCVSHWRINLKKSNGSLSAYIVESDTFSSLASLVEFYTTHELVGVTQNERIRLVKPHVR